jgi:hypothetical protein
MRKALIFIVFGLLALFANAQKWENVKVGKDSTNIMKFPFNPPVFVGVDEPSKVYDIKTEQKQRHFLFWSSRKKLVIKIKFEK